MLSSPLLVWPVALVYYLPPLPLQLEYKISPGQSSITCRGVTVNPLPGESKRPSLRQVDNTFFSWFVIKIGSAGQRCVFISWSFGQTFLPDQCRECQVYPPPQLLHPTSRRRLPEKIQMKKAIKNICAILQLTCSLGLSSTYSSQAGSDVSFPRPGLGHTW